MTPHDWDHTPISVRLFGDQGPWTWEVPTLWQGLADPDGPWTPPVAPWRSKDNLAQRIAFWAPLLTLTYGVLGWTRPDVGAQRWMDAGRPIDEPALAVLERWWGSSTIGVTVWAQRSIKVDHYSEAIAEATASKIGPRLPLPPVKPGPGLEGMVSEGGDPLHLGHVLEHLLGDPTLGGVPHETGRLIHDAPIGRHREASLILESYSGWYGTLARLGAQLPRRSWRVHVTVAPLGYLGTYRQSQVTGRWFAGRHKWHMLGWTE